MTQTLEFNLDEDLQEEINKVKGARRKPKKISDEEYINEFLDDE